MMNWDDLSQEFSVEFVNNIDRKATIEFTVSWGKFAIIPSYYDLLEIDIVSNKGQKKLMSLVADELQFENSSEYILVCRKWPRTHENAKICLKMVEKITFHNKGAIIEMRDF